MLLALLRHEVARPWARGPISPEQFLPDWQPCARKRPAEEVSLQLKQYYALARQSKEHKR